MLQQLVYKVLETQLHVLTDRRYAEKLARRELLQRQPRRPLRDQITKVENRACDDSANLCSQERLVRHT